MAAAAEGGELGGVAALVWLRNDLRLHDSVSIASAVAAVEAGEVTSVVPVYCLDPHSFRVSEYGCHKVGHLRTGFLLESLRNLRAGLRAVGSDLLLLVGPPEEALPGAAARFGARRVYAQAEITPEERHSERAVSAALLQVEGGCWLELGWGLSMFHPEDLPFGEGLVDFPDSFTQFRRAVEEVAVSVRELHPTPEAGQLPPPPGGLADLSGPDLPDSAGGLLTMLGLACNGYAGPPAERCPMEGGEAAALARVEYYFWETDMVAEYFNTRNGLLGADFSTKLSAALALGCLSPRRLAAEVRRYEAERTANKSTYWIIFELMTRDYYKFFAMRHGAALFAEFGLEGIPIMWDPNPELLRRWRDGATGMPLVDASMRELAATGYMSNRGRQNVASFLIMEYGVDWRLGADYFESRLVDYDPALNWGNWLAAAGLAGGRLNRFNVVKQSRDYDACGDYLRAWLPELARCPADCIHEPWLMTQRQQEEHGVRLGVDYPLPLSEEDLPFGRMKQMERIKAERRARKAAGRKPPGSRRGRGAAQDKYSYHDDKRNKAPVGTQPVMRRGSPKAGPGSNAISRLGRA